MPPIYDGSECTYCEGDAGAEHGFDEETPCDECGWYRRRSDGFRYPSNLPEVKAFTASTWQLALNKVEQIQEDFPELSKGSIVGAVEVVGVDDDEYGTEARAVLAKSVRDKRVEAEFPDIRRDLIGTSIVGRDFLIRNRKDSTCSCYLVFVAMKPATL